MLKYLIKYVFGIKNYNPMHKLSADTNYLQTKITLQVRKLILQTEYSNTVELWKKNLPSQNISHYPWNMQNFQTWNDKKWLPRTEKQTSSKDDFCFW